MFFISVTFRDICRANCAATMQHCVKSVKQLPFCRSNVMPFSNPEDRGSRLARNVSPYRPNYMTLDPLTTATIFSTKSHKTSNTASTVC